MTVGSSGKPAGILPGQEIEAHVDAGELITIAEGQLTTITGEAPTVEEWIKENIAACSYDLRIGTLFRDGQIINETHPRANEQILIGPGESEHDTYGGHAHEAYALFFTKILKRGSSTLQGYKGVTSIYE